MTLDTTYIAFDYIAHADLRLQRSETRDKPICVRQNQRALSRVA